MQNSFLPLLFWLLGLTLVSLPFVLRVPSIANKIKTKIESIINFRIKFRMTLGWAILSSQILYIALIAAFVLLERNQGSITAQGWPFYAIAACMWVVLAFPAVAWTVLRRQKQ